MYNCHTMRSYQITMHCNEMHVLQVQVYHMMISHLLSQLTLAT